MRVRVPASIANLGPGFDVLAMAVDLWLEVEAQAAGEAAWTFEGEGADWLGDSDHPFADVAMRGRVVNGIPVGVGLGSSAAARAAALALCGVRGRELLARTAALEGHADNAAAALQGGVVAVVGGAVHRLPAPRTDVALFVAAERVPTEAARAVLPRRVSREDAIFNAARLALLVRALHTRRYALLAEALNDRLHQSYRARLYPWLPAAIAAGVTAGAYGAALSGAGPSVMAFTPVGEGQRIGRAMAEAAGVPGRVVVTRPVKRGLTVSP
ncbi:MAG TPA: homoserine kinase [Candidatus Dormibacteraeota bacterium]